MGATEEELETAVGTLLLERVDVTEIVELVVLALALDDRMVVDETDELVELLLSTLTVLVLIEKDEADVVLAVTESTGAEEVVVSMLTTEDDADVTLAVIGLTSAEEVVVSFAGVGDVPIGGCGNPVVPFEGAPPYHTPFHAAMEPFFGSVPVTGERTVQESSA